MNRPYGRLIIDDNNTMNVIWHYNKRIDLDIVVIGQVIPRLPNEIAKRIQYDLIMANLAK